MTSRWRTSFPQIASVVGALLFLAGCGSTSSDSTANSTASTKPTSVVATFYPLAWMAEQIGGDLVEVTNLTPPGVEPHDLELAPDQVEALTDADVAIVMGKGFQPGPEKVAAMRTSGTVSVLSVDAIVDRLGTAAESAADHDHDNEGANEGEGANGVDPHVWLDPTRFSLVRAEVVRVLTAARPADEATFRTNADALGVALADLDTEMSTGLKTCDRRVFVTSHAAFGRLASRYGLEQQAISGLSPDAEPDPERIAELADLVTKRGVTTVFTEELVPAEFAETLAREAKIKTATLSPIEGPSAADIRSGASYLTIMRANLAALRSALGCR